MEHQDKNIEKYFRKLAEEQQPKSFPNMDDVWGKIEQKLDGVETKKVVPFWKYAGIAAALLVFVSLGIRFIIREDEPSDLNGDVEKVVMERIAHEEPVKNKVLKDERSTEKASKEPAKIPVNEIAGALVETEGGQNVSVEKDSVPAGIVNTPPLTDQELVQQPEIKEDNFQPVKIKGVVKTDLGDPIPGAVVMVAGAGKSTETDLEGNYELILKPGDKVNVRYLGFKTVTANVPEHKNILNITMTEDESVQLAELVVDSYRTMPKSRSNAVAVTSRTIEGRPNANLIQTLQAQVPGIAISAGSGQPGDHNTIVNLRGTGSVNSQTEPLYVVDGVPVSADRVRLLNPNDIKSIAVLKDTAVTALYGNRAANGVINIETNKSEGKKSRRARRKNKKNAMSYEAIQKAFPPVATDMESYESFSENPFESSISNPVSTFSVDVDNASYTNIRRLINNGQKVPKDAVRIEEMVNFFKYDYPHPGADLPFAINSEYSDAPWNTDHKLLKVGLQGKEIPMQSLPKSNLVFLVDLSGSMDAPNKLPLLKESLKVLLGQLRPDDRISIVYYASNTGVLLEPTRASEKQKITEVIDRMQSGGGTFGDGGIELAYELASKHFVKDGNNRIILATDGDFNIGKSSDKEMQQLIEEKRKTGVFLTCLGFGMRNYKDSKMIMLSKKGNGNYAYIDNIQEANRFLGKEFKGSMFAIAKDVKIQVEFNPAHVQAYRLIGYEMRKLRNEDFTNDAVDAGEIGSGHRVTAFYEIIPAGTQSDFYKEAQGLKYSKVQNSGTYSSELATIKFRYKKPDADVSSEITEVIPSQSKTLRETSKDFKFAAAVAWFGLKLRDSQLIREKDTEAILKLAKEGIQNDDDGYKAELTRLIESAK